MHFKRFLIVPWGGARSVDFIENPRFGSGGLRSAVSTAAEASVFERLRTYQNYLPHGVMDLPRFHLECNIKLNAFFCAANI